MDKIKTPKKWIDDNFHPYLNNNLLDLMQLYADYYHSEKMKEETTQYNHYPVVLIEGKNTVLSIQTRPVFKIIINNKDSNADELMRIIQESNGEGIKFPAREDDDCESESVNDMAYGWNSCIDMFKKLNGIE